MRTILLGHHSTTGAPVRIPKEAFRTHFHLIGGTGKGKTTAIHTILHQLMMNPLEDECFIIVDRLGNLSHELLLWMASDFCTDRLRSRLVYIEAAREQSVISFNPLLYETEAEGYYKVQRATEIILRAWESVDLAAMPRLARWTFNAFWAVAQLGLTIADSVHLLMPRSGYHTTLLKCLPEGLRAEWGEVIAAKGKSLELLDSSRNRLKPYYESSILRRMFGSTRSRLDVLRFMQEGRIVVLNLAPMGRIPTQVSDALGGMVLNEVLATARALAGQGVVYPTYLLLDEFQNFVGPDIESALPEVRQLGLRLILSHQSFSQLERGDYDLTSMIFQAQSRMVFGLQGQDADTMAHELASHAFDPMRIKEENYVRRQRFAGYRLVELANWSESEGAAESWNESYGRNWSAYEGVSRGLLHDTPSEGSSQGGSEGGGRGGAQNRSRSHGMSQQYQPIHEDYLELANRVFSTFEEQRAEWGKTVRRLKTGKCVLHLVDDDELYDVNVKQSKAGYLAWDLGKIRRALPGVFDNFERLKEENFRSEWFTSPQEIDREIHERLERLSQLQLPAPSSEEVRFG